MMKTNQSPSTSESSATQSGPHADRWTTKRLLTWVANYLNEKSIESPRLHAEILLSHILNCKRVELYTAHDRPASPDELSRLRDLVRRAAAHEPVAYLTGEAWFFAMRFTVSPEVLIPRPSTETIIEFIMQHQRTGAPSATNKSANHSDHVNHESSQIHHDSSDEVHQPATESTSSTTPTINSPPINILDLCTGSGCLAVTLAKHLPQAQITASDISAEALRIAQKNADDYNLSDRVQFIEGSLFEPITGQFDFIVSNPPYISDPEWEEVEPNVRDYEPTIALRAGPQGLDYLQPIIEQIHHYLKPQTGLGLLEIASSQESAVRHLVNKNPHLDQTPTILRDLDGHPRILVLKHRENVQNNVAEI